MSSGTVAVRDSLDLKGLNLSPNAWLSDIVGWPCLTVCELSSLGDDEYHRKSGRCFFEAKVPVGQGARTEDLIRRGFSLIDTSLTLRRDVSCGNFPRVCADSRLSRSDDLYINAARPEEAIAVASIASRAFKYSRFHLDPRFPEECAQRIKGEWARNLVSGLRGEGCLVARRGNRVVGFLGYLRPMQQDAPNVIDLVAVDPSEQGTGVGKEIVAMFLASADNDRREVIVGTQAVNRSSVRLYENLGFRLDSADYVLHGHCMTPPNQ